MKREKKYLAVPIEAVTCGPKRKRHGLREAVWEAEPMPYNEIPGIPQRAVRDWKKEQQLIREFKLCLMGYLDGRAGELTKVKWIRLIEDEQTVVWDSMPKQREVEWVDAAWNVFCGLLGIEYRLHHWVMVEN